MRIKYIPCRSSRFYYSHNEEGRLDEFISEHLKQLDYNDVHAELTKTRVFVGKLAEMLVERNVFSLDDIKKLLDIENDELMEI